MKYLKYIFIALIACASLSGQLTTPGGTVLDKNVSVDSSNIYRRPTAAQIYDANLDPYVTGLGTVTIAGGDFLYFIDATDGLPKKGDAADLLTAGTPGLTVCFIPRANACSVLIDSCFFQSSDNLYGTSTNFNIGTSADHIQFTLGEIQFQPGNKNLFDIREDVGGKDIVDMIAQTQISGADSSFSLSKPGCFGNRAYIQANNLTAQRWQEFTDMGLNACVPASFAMWNQAASTIEVDYATQCSGAVTLFQSYEFTVASGACGCFSNVVLGTLSGTIQIGTVFSANLSCTPANYDGATIEPVLKIESTSMRLNSSSSLATANTFIITPDGLVDGQIFDLEWTHATNRGELLDTGIFRLAGDWSPDQYDSITIKWNGTDFIEQGRSAN